MCAVGIERVYLAVDVAKQDLSTFDALDLIFSLFEIFQVELVNGFELEFLCHSDGLDGEGPDSWICSKDLGIRPDQRSTRDKLC